MSAEPTPIPEGTLSGLRTHWKSDLLSGFLVFLIALPLCLGIALACGYPAIAGIFTAIVGGLIATFFSNSELTIKGPAAGLIVIAIGCITEFGYTGGHDPVADYEAYRLALGVGVAAGMLQIFLGIFRTGILGEFFPTSTIHGLLAAIGVIIIAKQFPIAMGLSSEGKPLDLLAKIPEFIMNMNPIVGLIGMLSFIILLCYPFIKQPHLKMVPAPMIVLFVTIPLGMFFHINQEHTYSFLGQQYALGKQFLVNVPDNMFQAVAFPNFSGLLTATGIKYVIMFALIGSLESLLSAKAIDGIDPWKRKTNMDQDMLAVGIGNTLAAFVGGLPMISEIVRSKANIDNGARTRFANLFHGLFLLLFVALLPGLIRQIPLAALGAMLVFTGFRLASPQEFGLIYKIGKDQFIIFVSTVIGVLETDLLMGIAIGIGVKILLHLFNGVPFRSLFKLHIDIEQHDTHHVTMRVKQSAVFSTWIALRKHLQQSLDAGKDVTLDLAETRLVDHTVMTKLLEWKYEFSERHRQLTVIGLEHHQPLSNHIVATHKKIVV
ncbi:MAG: SulP family inorganic anion transporter [Nitrospirales bacterium]|nr:SulP family inorganic anion transporter [Nitrospirales bacterium]